MVTFFQLLMPVACCLLILYLQHLAEEYSHYNVEHPFEQSVGYLSDCIGDDCTTLGYGIIGESTDPESEEYEWI